MRNMKLRLLSALLAVAMMFVMMPVGAFADDTTIAQLPACKEGEFDDSTSGLRYKIKTDAVDEVTVVGPVEVRTERVIPDTVEYDGKTYTVTEIADNAFSCYGTGDREDLNTPYTPFVGRPDFVSVTIPRTVTRIGKYAFYACTEWGQFYHDGAYFNDIGLQSITIEAGSQLRIIDDAAFAGCYTLKEFTVPSSVESIGEDAFYDCACIKSLTFEDGSMLQSIGKNAFHWNDGLTNVELPEGLKAIGDGAFYDCTGLEDITIPGSVETIGENAFDVDTAKGHESSLKDINYTGTEEQWNELMENTTGSNTMLKDESITVNCTYTVTFLDNEHNTVTPAQKVQKGNKATKPTDPTAKGYKFAGWYTDAECTTAFEFAKPITANTTVYAKWEKIPDHQLTVSGGTFTVDGAEVDGETAEVLEGATVEVTFKKDFYADSNLVFDGWEISGLENAEDYQNKENFAFTMPKNGVTINARTKSETDDSGWDAGTVVTTAVLGAGAAVLTYHIGTELYAEQVLGKGVSVPKTREDVALKAWELAGKPAVELNGEPLNETAQAEKWAVESGLMQNVDGSFNGAKKMNKLKALRVLDKAQKLG